MWRLFQWLNKKLEEPEGSGSEARGPIACECSLAIQCGRGRRSHTWWLIECRCQRRGRKPKWPPPPRFLTLFTPKWRFKHWTSERIPETKKRILIFEKVPRWAVGLGYRRGTTYTGAYMCFLEQRLLKTRTTILQKFETFQKKRDSSRIDIRDLCNAIIYTIVYISSL